VSGPSPQRAASDAGVRAGTETGSERPRPFVSIVLPVRNEADHIEACLERLMNQDYPRDRLEILVVDGESDDATREIVAAIQARRPDVDLRLIDNPHRVVPPALNIGFRAAKGSVFVRMDGHSVPATNYVSACIDALERFDAGNAGGVIEAVGTTPFGRAVAIASLHPLGAGDAKYRVGGEAGEVETVPFGAFRREVLERVGLFDESLVRNQDDEMNVRIRASGARVVLDPAIRVTYTPRGSVRGLWSQYFQYGWWRIETLKRHPGSMRWRFAVPPLAAGGFVGALLLAPFWAFAAQVLLLGSALYAVLLVAVAARIARPGAAWWRIALAFALMHFGYGLGFVTHVLTRGRFPYRAGAPHVPRLEGPKGDP
jgi:succinoglycan biosynthesis protein ExoA